MAYLYAILTVIIWSGNAVVNKLSAGSIDPAAISFYRWFLAFLLLTPFVIKKIYQERMQISAHALKLFTLGFLGMAVYQSLAYYAAYHITAVTMGIFISIIPLLTIILSLFILKTKPTFGLLIGSLLSFFGIAWLISEGEPLKLLAIGVGKGEIFMLIAAISYALYGVLTKKWAMPLASWSSIYMQIFFAVILLLIPFLNVNNITLSEKNIWLIAYAGIPTSILAPLLWMTCILKIGANKASLFLNLSPIVTALISILILNEQLYSYYLIGGSISLLGVLLAQNLKIKFNKNSFTKFV